MVPVVLLHIFPIVFFLLVRGHCRIPMYGYINYNVIFLLKQESSESASIGKISGMGLSYRKDNTVDIERYTLIRVTFRNKRLIQSRIWGDITTSSVSGFKIKRQSE